MDLVFSGLLAMGGGGGSWSSSVSSCSGVEEKTEGVELDPVSLVTGGGGSGCCGEGSAGAGSGARGGQGRTEDGEERPWVETL